MTGGSDVRSVLVGRQSARSELTRCLADAAAGQGGLVLLAGEAGVGKTHLATTAIVESQLFPLRATASHTTATPFAPLVSALRAFLRAIPDGLPCDGPVGRNLPVLLPERGSMADVDRVTLFETLVGAFLAMSRHQPTVVFLDDFHEADQATLELIPSLSAAARHLPLLLLGAYRADELRRDHPLRRLRAELRRTGPLRELVVEPLAADETADMAAHLLRGPVACQLARLLFERSDGLPLFVEELLTTLTATGRLQQVDGVWQLADPAALLPVPDSIRDLVLAGAARLGCRARAALELAAVAGARFELDVVAPLCDADDALDEAFALGLLVKLDAHEAAFRHALIRDAFYGDIARSRRRALHHQLAERLERRGTSPAVVANHWFAAREPERARRALLLATDAACRMHAYRDAAAHAQRAIDVWPHGRDEQQRAEALDRLGRCAQLIGNLDAAAAAWREVADQHNRAGRSADAAQTLRMLAGVYELQHAWELALAAREAAAEAFATSGAPASRCAAARGGRAPVRGGELHPGASAARARFGRSPPGRADRPAGTRPRPRGRDPCSERARPGWRRAAPR
jgi:predicted ATPase